MSDEKQTARERAEESRETMRQVAQAGERGLDAEPTHAMVDIVFQSSAVLCLRYIGDAIMAAVEVGERIAAGLDERDDETVGRLKARIERLIHKDHPPCTEEEWKAAKACVEWMRLHVVLSDTQASDRVRAFDMAMREVKR